LCGSSRVMRIDRDHEQTLRRAALSAACLLVVLLPGCQLTDADQVARSPTLGRGSGGSGGRDLGVAGQNSEDAPAFTSVLRDAAYAYDVATIPVGSDVAADRGVFDATWPSETVVLALDAPESPLVKGSCADGSGSLFCDDFEGKSDLWITTGSVWTVAADPADTGHGRVFGPTTAGASTAYLAGAAWHDVTVEVQVKMTSLGQTATNRVLVYARYQNSDQFYALALQTNGQLALRKSTGTLGATAVVPVAPQEWHTLKIRVVSDASQNAEVEGYFDGSLYVAVNDPPSVPPNSAGSSGIGVYGDVLAVFDDFKVSPP